MADPRRSDQRKEKLRRRMRGKQKPEAEGAPIVEEEEGFDKPHSHLANRRRLHGKQRAAAPPVICPGIAGPNEGRRAESRRNADIVVSANWRRRNQQPFVKGPP